MICFHCLVFLNRIPINQSNHNLFLIYSTKSPDMTSKKNIKKQILTLHRKIKKKDKIETEYVIEKDDHKGRYHSHLVIHYNDENNLYNQLNRFIVGSTWISENSGFDEVKTYRGN
jgi:hypothetical protein